MATSFIGSFVNATLHGGDQIQGSIIALDPSTGTLMLQQGAQTIPLARTDIADISIIPVPATQQASTSSQVQHAPPHVSPHIPTAPAAMSRGDSGAGTPKKKTKAANGGKKGRFAKESSAFGRPTIHDNGSDLDEDFDFDKALKGFDKEKVWQEIKTADRSDPAHLLVSHNRRGTPSNAHDEKLAWNEPVLSPSTTTKGSDFNVDGLQVELDRVRGSALQRDLELSKVREQAKQSDECCVLLQALLGVQVAKGEQSDWTIRIYESAAAMARGSAETGTVAVSITSPFGGRLRYLGPITSQSDPEVVQRLPETYKGEMGLKVEHAPLFFRRLKEAIQI